MVKLLPHFDFTSKYISNFKIEDEGVAFSLELGMQIQNGHFILLISVQKDEEQRFNSVSNYPYINY